MRKPVSCAYPLFVGGPNPFALRNGSAPTVLNNAYSVTIITLHASLDVCFSCAAAQFMQRSCNSCASAQFMRRNAAFSRPAVPDISRAANAAHIAYRGCDIYRTAPRAVYRASVASNAPYIALRTPCEAYSILIPMLPVVVVISHIPPAVDCGTDTEPVVVEVRNSFPDLSVPFTLPVDV